MDDQTTETTNPVQSEEIRADLDVPTEEIASQTGEMEVQDVESVEEKKSDTDVSVSAVASEPAVEPVAEPKKNQVDPSFDCVPCEGEGLIRNNIWPEGRVCVECGGTGKKNRGVDQNG